MYSSCPNLRRIMAWPFQISALYLPTNFRHEHEIYREVNSLEQEKGHFTHFDYEITEREISQAAKKLKNKKSPFVVKIRNEMIKAILEPLMPIFFNLILQSEKMPDVWCQGLITPIYKSGDKSDPTNYKGICVSSCLENCSALFQIEDFTCILRKIRYYTIPKLAFCLKIARQTMFLL